MRRATAQRLRFKLPIDVNKITNLNIVFAQDNRVILQKGLEECSLAGNVIVTWLSGKDTSILSSYVGSVEIQIRGITNLEYEFATKIIRVPVRRILREGRLYERFL